MTWSAAEVLALAVKAARGGGTPAGQAARFGEAAVAHLKADRAPEVLDAALAALPKGPVLDYPLKIDAALAGAGADAGVSEVSHVADDELFCSYIDALPFRAEMMTSGQRVLFRIMLDQPAERGGAARISGCDTLIARMREMAQAVLVPESEASRAAGAGAGLTDND